MHALWAALELLPIISQIVSLAEKCMFKCKMNSLKKIEKKIITIKKEFDRAHLIPEQRFHNPKNVPITSLQKRQLLEAEIDYDYNKTSNAALIEDWRAKGVQLFVQPFPPPEETHYFINYKQIKISQDDGNKLIEAAKNITDIESRNLLKQWAEKGVHVKWDSLKDFYTNKEAPKIKTVELHVIEDDCIHNPKNIHMFKSERAELIEAAQYYNPIDKNDINHKILYGWLNLGVGVRAKLALIKVIDTSAF